MSDHGTEEARIRYRPYHGEEPWHSGHAATVREVVFGVQDGLVATLGLVTGVAAAHSDHVHIVVAGVAAAVANVVSMGVGSYISTQAQVDFERAEVERERREIVEKPEEELAEMREIYTGYGFSREEVETFARRFRQDPELWLEFMLRDELGILREHAERPLRNALSMAAAVLAGSAVPVLPFLVSWPVGRALGAAFALSAAAAFALGVGKSRVARGSPWRSGLTFLLAAAAAAAVGIGVGALVARWVGGVPPGLG